MFILFTRRPASLVLSVLTLPLIVLSTIAAAQSPMIYQPPVPSSIAPGSARFMLTIRGEGFVRGAKIRWNGTNVPTTFVSSSQLSATIPATDVAKANTATITVQNPGRQISNGVFFSVTKPITSVANTLFYYPVSTGDFFAAKTLAVDVNGDGILDLVILNESYGVPGSVSVVLGNSDGSFRPPTTYASGTTSKDMVAVDLNGDHFLDLLVADSDDDTMSVLLGNGDGTFQPRVTYSSGGSLPWHIAAADMNGDGNVDAIVTNRGDGHISVLLGNGDGTFRAPITTIENGAFTAPAIADFNGDSKLDIAVGNFDTNGNMVYVLLGNGDGTFQAPVGYTLPYYYPSDVETADLNGDGHLDLAVAGTFLATLMGNGDGTFQPAVGVGSESLMGSIAFGDLNGDGKIDIIGGALDNTIYYLGNGNGTFQDFVPLGLINSSSDSTTVGDFNHDGALDIVTGGANIYYNGNVSLAPQVRVSTRNLNFGKVAVGHNRSLNLTITDAGNAPLFIDNINIIQPRSAPFSMDDGCFTQTGYLYPGQSCTVAVTFTPTSTGAASAHMKILDDAANNPQVVGLTGTGTH